MKIFVLCLLCSSSVYTSKLKGEDIQLETREVQAKPIGLAMFSNDDVITSVTSLLLLFDPKIRGTPPASPLVLPPAGNRQLSWVFLELAVKSIWYHLKQHRIFTFTKKSCCFDKQHFFKTQTFAKTVVITVFMVRHCFLHKYC